ncbi:MAG: hypothetical protein H0U43_09720, partial [Chthoniobacterales bacterium]|nr:hypothetical protein [Chthoniobacterales bacterium]
MPATSLRALTEGSIDYAGLFPPASLALEPALRNHAEYVRSADAWMLGAFVLPLSKFDDAAVDMKGFDGEHRLEISGLGSKTDTPSEFISMLATAASTIGRFAARNDAFARVNQLEVPLATQPGAGIAEAYHALAEVRV